MIRTEAQIDRAGIEQASHEEARSDQQYQGDRNLKDDQGIARVEASRSLEGDDLILQGREQIRPGGAQRGSQTEQHGGDCR